MKSILIGIFIFSVVILSTGCSDSAAKYSSDIKIPDVVGDWKVGGGVANVAGDNALALSFTTETGTKGVGTISGGRIEVESWKVTGRLSADRKNIYWDNNVTWSR